MKHTTRQVTYPIDIDAERAFISAFLSGNYNMDQYHALTCNDFFTPEHKVILYAIMELDSDHIRISKEECVRQLERTGEISTAVLSALDAIEYKLISEDEIQIIRRRILDCAIGRRLIDRLIDTTSWLAEGDINSEQFLQWTLDCLNELQILNLYRNCG